VQWMRLWWGGLALLCILALGLWLRPYVLSIYHLESGGRALEASLEPVFPDRLAPEQIVEPARLQAGMVHLGQAIRWDGRNVQAMRLLARGYLSQGQQQAALEVLQRAAELRPENPLLRLELGDVYDALGRTQEAIEAYEGGGVGSRGEVLAVNYLKMAEAQVQAGSGEVAIDLWRRVVALDPGNVYARYRLVDIHQDMGDEARATEYELELQHMEPCSVTVPLDPRMAQYQGEGMGALVEVGIWQREKLLAVIADQVERVEPGVPRSMLQQMLETILARWPEDVELQRQLEILRGPGATLRPGRRIWMARASAPGAGS